MTLHVNARFTMVPLKALPDVNILKSWLFSIAWFFYKSGAFLVQKIIIRIKYFKTQKNENILHIINQIKVSKVPDIAIFAWRVTWNNAYSPFHQIVIVILLKCFFSPQILSIDFLGFLESNSKDRKWAL